MPHAERLKLITEIEEIRGSRVICLVTGDRPVAPTIIADDLLRPLYDHLLEISKSESGKTKKIDLVLYTRGGSVETPWKMVTKIRQFCQQFSVIIPYKAHSAGTMLALGTDTILMSPMGELGPIDPALQLRGDTPGRTFLLPDLGVEDVAAYLSFLKERARITDQAALAETVKALADHLTPTLLGRMERIYSHIRLVARKLMSLQKPPLPEATIDAIADALTEKMYAHGHGIGVDEAESLGLRVERMDSKLDALVWKLLLDYEEEMKLLTSADASSYFANELDSVYEEPNAIGVCIESRSARHTFRGTVRIERIRKIPSPLNLNLSFPLNLPPSVTPQNLPQQIQQLIQQLLQQAGGQLQQLIQAELAKQAPIQGISQRWVGGVWKRET